MDDNAPYYRITVLRDWFAEHSRQFEPMIWPLSMPDVNLIEQLWDIIERSVYARNLALAILSQLWTVIEAVWFRISSGYFRRLVEPMSCQIAALLRVKRGPTQY